MCISNTLNIREQSPWFFENEVPSLMYVEVNSSQVINTKRLKASSIWFDPCFSKCFLQKCKENRVSCGKPGLSKVKSLCLRKDLWEVWDARMEGMDFWMWPVNASQFFWPQNHFTICFLGKVDALKALKWVTANLKNLQKVSHYQ